MKPTFFRTASALRRWLAAHHETSTELVVGFHKKHTGIASLTYQQALDEALAVGWIDGVRRKLDDERYTIRFTPRRPRSRWSQVNIKWVRELTARGLMKPPGLVAFKARMPPSQPYSYETRPRRLGPQHEKLFKSHAVAWTFFQSQPPGYRRVAIWWIVSAKQDETQSRRLAQLIERSAKRQRLL